MAEDAVVKFRYRITAHMINGSIVDFICDADAYQAFVADYQTAKRPYDDYQDKFMDVDIHGCRTQFTMRDIVVLETEVYHGV